ncbi:MAG: tryptophan-rich sensory protein [Deltaproteobacteria bacterium]|nr:tryptophan-rich sensory protein [Deltaproteobacteria bacterium]
MSIRSGLGLVGSIAVCFGVAAVGGYFTPGEWYQQLQKPLWTPPPAVFGPVWTLLYFLMGVSAWLVWRRKGLREGTLPLASFAFQLFLNGLWSFIFFGLHRIGLAGIEIILLWSAIAVTLFLFWRESKIAGILLIPYLVWVLFAGVLNFAIWRLNA